MGIVRLEERSKTEIEEFRRMLIASASAQRRKDSDGAKFPAKISGEDDGDGGRGRPICVTSGLSYLGVAVVDKLLSRGYSVRIIVDNYEDLERIEEMEMINNGNVKAIVARVTEQESLEEAFKDCGGVFHTSSFIDPNGFSGYTKYMVDLEERASENVVRACARTPSVKKCVMTSSLLACVWRRTRGVDHHSVDQQQQQQEIISSSLIINQHCWSDETLCIENKLWYALGKLRAEKAAWKVAEENGLKMATICPALITGPHFSSRNSTPTFAYLKGAKEMYGMGVLASVDVTRLANAHVCVYNAMSSSEGGRYICFDNLIQDQSQAHILAHQTGFSTDKICGSGSISNERFRLSDQKLSNLMSTISRPCYNQSLNN